MSLFQPLFAVLGDLDIVVFVLALFLVLGALVGYFFYAFIAFNRKGDVSPYSGMPLRAGREITFYMQDKVNQYLKDLHDYDNRPIDFIQTSFCRETGRIFPGSINWSGAIKLDWSFIKKRYPGQFVSWGSLSSEKQKEIQAVHHSFFGFQTETSSPNPSPRLIDEETALTKPGPLYVDVESNVLMGWKLIPETDLEVLIVQKPISVKLLNIHQKP